MATLPISSVSSRSKVPAAPYRFGAVLSILLTGALAPLPATASASDVVISGGWVGTTVPGQPVAGAYMDFSSRRGAVVQHITSDAAGEVQMHTMQMDGDIMRMRQIPEIVLPPGKTVRLASSSNHLMLLNLKQPLRPGSAVKLELKVRDAQGKSQVVRVSLPVREPGQGVAQ